MYAVYEVKKYDNLIIFKVFYQLDFRSPEILPELANIRSIIRESRKDLLIDFPLPVTIQRLFNLILELFLGK